MKNVLKNQMYNIQQSAIAYINAMEAQKIAAVDRFMEGKAEMDLLRTAFEREERSKEVIESLTIMVERIMEGDKYTIALLADLRGHLEMMMNEVYEVRHLL